MKAQQLLAENYPKFIESIDAVVMDCDGVIWHGNDPIDGAIEVVKTFKKLGKKTIFVTNNSTKTRDELFKKFQKLGFPVNKNEVYGTAHITAEYLKSLDFKSKVYVIGSNGISQELNDAGISNFGAEPDPVSLNEDVFRNIQLETDVGAVVVGFDAHLSYLKILKAASYLINLNCIFIATNTDEQFPSPNKDIVYPGSGVMVRSVEVASGRTAKVMGKPSVGMLEVISKDHNLTPKRTLMIGDRANTDILLGTQGGLQTLLVLTGVTNLQQVSDWIESGSEKEQGWIPDFWLSSIGDLLQLMT